MNFVTACANLRAHVFGIPQKSKFDVKGIVSIIYISNNYLVKIKSIFSSVLAMAGNIIPGRKLKSFVIFMQGIIVMFYRF